MKGKNKFSGIEAKAIRALLDKKMVSDRNEQKAIRNPLRKTHQFFIEDFTAKKGFAPKDFDALVKEAKIVVKKD